MHWGILFFLIHISTYLIYLIFNLHIYLISYLESVHLFWTSVYSFFLCFGIKIMQSLENDVKSMKAWGISSDLSPWNYNELNNYIPTNNTQAHLRNLCIRASEGRPFVWDKEVEYKRKKESQVLKNSAWSSQQDGRGQELFSGILALWSPKQSCLRHKHVLRSGA